MIRFGTVALAALLALHVADARAAPNEEGRADVERSPEELIRHTTEALLETISERRKEFAKSPERVEEAVARTLDAAVDFAGVARGVLGAHRARLSEAETARFEQKFRTTLVSVITEALVSLRPAKVEFRSTRRLREDAARVPMRVRTEDGQSFDLSYTLMRDASGWKVRNVVIEGVNLGMTYRNQFDGLVRRHGGDVEAAIEEWDQTVEDVADSVRGS